MSSQGNLAATLAGLSNWLQPAADEASFDSLMLSWVQTAGWRAAGIVSPCDGPTSASKAFQNGKVLQAAVPPELPDALRRLRQSEATATVTAVSGVLRVYAALNPPGRPMSVIWVERPLGVPLTDVDRSLVALTARLMENSAAFAATSGGPVVDPDRLLVRLQDAAVIAGRMAHDFDNILTGILGFAELSQPMLPNGSPVASFVAEISKVGHRGTQFTQQLHQLSRSGQVKPNPGSLAAALAKEESRLRPTMNPELRLEKNVPMGLPAVAVDAGPIQSVLGHVLENAIEACPTGGTVSVAARAVELTDADARAYLGKVGVGAHLEVTVVDNGPGIKPEVRRRLFAEPFFTTKVRHRGLGLVVVYRTLCVHRGGIRLDAVPAPGTGTVARFVLPLAAARMPVAGPTVLGAIPVGG